MLVFPDKLVIGFQEREDTYTGKLGFINYRDKNGDLRQEEGFNRWIKGEPKIFENKPQRGFILNKNKTHYSSYAWNYKRSRVRVYTPFDVEFEIDLDNLMFLLDYTDVSKKEILDECVIAFSGNKVKLIPVSSNEYQEHLRKTEKKEKKKQSNESKKDKVFTEKGETDLLYYIGDYPTRIKGNSIKEVSVFFNDTTEEFVEKKLSSLKESKAFWSKTYYEQIVSRFNPEAFKKSLVNINVEKLERDNKNVDKVILKKPYFYSHYRENEIIEYSLIYNGRTYYPPKEILKLIPRQKTDQTDCLIEIELSDNSKINILDYLELR